MLFGAVECKRRCIVKGTHQVAATYQLFAYIVLLQAMEAE